MRPFAFAAACVLASSAASACSIQDIKIKNWKWHVEDDFAIYVGELVNNCAEATGVELQVVFRDASGAAVDMNEFWAASTRNIEPGASYVFKSLSHWNAATESAEISIVDVRAW